MKEKKLYWIFILFISLLVFSACASQNFEGQSADNNPGNNAGNIQNSNIPVIDDRNTDEPLKEFRFFSEEDLISLSDEDVIYLAEHDYKTTYFVADFREEQYDDFGTSLTEFERFEPLLLMPEGSRADYDVDQKMSDEDYDRLIEERLEGFKEDISDIDITYFGETDHYVEYGYGYMNAGHYVSGRICFYRNEFMMSDTVGGSSYAGPVYLGELTEENVMSEEDFRHSNYSDNYLLLRAIEDRGDAIVYVSYYPYLKQDGDYDELGQFQRAEIIKFETIYYKETHRIDSLETVIRSVNIPGTVLYVPDAV